MKCCSEQGEKNHGNSKNVRILVMPKFGFKDKGLVKLIVGVVKHVTINELRPVDYRGIEAVIDFVNNSSLELRRVV
jgi:hypothetical protein